MTATALLVASGAVLSAQPAAADEPSEAPQAEFTGAVGYGFAAAMSTDGSTAVVGQLGDSTSTDVPGIAHVLFFDGADWTEQAELTATDPGYDMLFGNAVAVSADGNTVIVGDPGECGYGLSNCEHGAAYIFARDGSTWAQQAELHGGPGFGGAVALSSNGNVALVGAGLSGYYGFSYALGGNAPPTIFERSGTTWTQETTLSATGASGDFDNLGHSVALSADGHTALIGDPTQDEEAGAAYVFTGGESTWTQQAKLTGSDETKQWNFGASVAISADGRTALAGAPAPGAGSAYVFTGNGSTWTQQSELTPDDAKVESFDGWFGDAVALDSEGNVALVGAPWAEEDLGAVYAFAGESSNWSQQAEFTLLNATPYDYFGGAVALDGEGNVALIGRYDPGVDFFHVPKPHFPGPPTGGEPPETPAAQSGTTALSTTPQSSSVLTTSSAGKDSDAVAELANVSTETLSPATFRAAPRGPSAVASASRYGTEATYTVNTVSNVRFTVDKVEAGRRSPSGRCERPTKTSRGTRRCTRLVALAGDFTRVSYAGVNRFRFTGRLAKHTLAAGSYRLIATPTADGRVGHAATAAFRVAQ